jgi:hypothetical protein
VSTDARGRPEGGAAGLLLAALAGAIAFRLYLLAAADFPVNDGALFLEFVRAISVTFPALPREVGYNGLVLPFAYPPLSFWIAALWTKLGFDSLAVVRTMPILMNIGYVLLFALVLLKSGRSQLFTALAILFFSVTLRSFEWLLMGGGLSRGLGAVFLMLTLLAIKVPEQGRKPPLSRWRVAIAGAAVAGAILSHLEWGILSAACVVLSRGLGSHSIKNFVADCTTAGTVALTLALPWLFLVQQTHGLEPFLSAGATGAWSTQTVIRRLIEFIAMAGVGNPFAIIGGVVLLGKRQWFWIGFTFLCAVLTPRHALTPMVLALAVFAAQGVFSFYESAGRFVRSRKLLTVSVASIVGLLLAHGVFAAHRNSGTSFRVLPPEMRLAMAWVAANHSGAAFAIVNDRQWHNDSTGEWFPTLAAARAVTTVQGREWNGEFGRWVDMSAALRASENCAELHANLRAFGQFEFVWAETMKGCFVSPSYRLAFQNERVSIYRKSDLRR